MSLARGSVFGQYEIAAFIGEGGMGTVYRARDRKLKREVAIKLLPDAFATDPDRLARFQREAEALAALNHPNIGAIYDLQEVGGTAFLVLELVEGDALDELIRRRGSVPVDETIDKALQICSALEAAHDKGIVHRDLKPANVKIAADGTVKLLDFGLATMREQRVATEGQTESITRLELSSDRSVSGTPAYMAPEQLRAEPVDRRVDVWAFGCVVYQMLTGAAPFRGATTADTFAAIVSAEPDWSRLPPGTPAPLRALLRQCLQKDRRHRLGYIADARIWLEDLVAHPAADAIAARAPARSGRALWWAGWIAALAALAALAVVVWRDAAPHVTAEARVQVGTPPGSDAVAFALSPDGRTLVFPATAEGRTQLWLRPLDSFTAQPLAGTDGAAFPFWSPSGDSVAFFADGELKRLDLAGGVPAVLAKAPLGRGGTWSASGVIVFAPSGTGPLFKVSASSGDAAALTQLEPGDMSHRFPQFLRDGEHFIYFAAGQSPGLRVGSIRGGAAKRIVATGLAGVVTPTGYLLYLHEGTVLAQPFDEKKLELAGSPVPVAEQVAVDSGAFVGALTAAADSVAYRPSGAGRRQLTWFDREGKLIESVGAPDPGVLTGAEISPDGKRVAVNRMLNGNLDVWLVDASKGALTRLTFEPPLDAWPHWTADGGHILFSSNAKGTYNLYEKPAGGGPDRSVLDTAQAKIPQDVSPDGRTVLFASLDPQTGFDLWTAPMAGGEPPRVFLKTPFQESGGQFSPDGRWVAYHSNESGRYEVYVQPVDGGQDRRIQVSTNGGAQPRWRRDGKELFFVSLDSRLMAAAVSTSAATGALDISTPVALFAVNIVGGPVLLNNTQQYGVSPDGQRFLINVPIDTTPPINLLEHWKPSAN